jgi:hypothetical protein
MPLSPPPRSADAPMGDAPSSRARAVVRAARRLVLPLLAIPAAAFAAGSIGPRMALVLPVWTGNRWYVAVLQVAGLAVIIALPVALLALSGVRWGGWARGAVAACMAAYALAMARPIVLLGIGAAEYVRLARMPEELHEQREAALAFVRARPNPEAEARRALWWGDDRYYAVSGITIRPPAPIRWSPRAEEVYGMKLMPGFSDVLDGSIEEDQVASEAGCWVFRYDTVMAHARSVPGAEPGHELDERYMDWVHHDCDPRPATGR